MRSSVNVPVLRFGGCDLDSITLDWSGEPAVEYKLEFREAVKKGWDSASSLRIAPSADGAQSVTVVDLLPSMTYVFRLWVLAADGKPEGPGPDTAFDTQVVSCGPSQRTCCGCSVS